jgi:peptide/nickel transport system substrate-binding protein
MTSNQDEEKMALAYQRTAGALGIDVSVRTVDDAQFQKRRQTWDYDMTAAQLSASLSPGAEQVWRWDSRSRDVEGTFNYAGAADPAIDAMIDAMLNAREREDFAAAVRALDRILISGHYVIPLYHIRRVLGGPLGSRSNFPTIRRFTAISCRSGGRSK